MANRGEISLRITQAIRELDKLALVIHSDNDKQLPFVTEADEAYSLGSGDLSQTYLNIEKIISIAREAQVDAIHPGYGFLAENADFARACEEKGIHFIGPTAEVIALYSAKNNLIMNIIHFVDSTLKSKPELQNDIELSSDQIISLIPVLVETSIIEKNWSPDKSYIELECNFDFELFNTRLEKITRIKEEIERIIKLKNKSDKANIQIETIRSKTDSVGGEANKFKLQLEYFNNINVLKELEYFQKGYSAYLRKDYNISISYLTKMIELNPDNDFGYYNL